MQKIGNPTPLFFDLTRRPMDGGKIYVGIPDGDPVTDPIDVFWDSDLTIPAVQPLRTIGGYIVNGTTPALAFIDEADYSMRVLDSADTLVEYSPSVFTDASAFQPSSAELTLLAALSSTAFGRSLLELANSAALAAATGLPAALPAAGGTVSGPIVRQGAGVHFYWYDPLLTSGRAFQITTGDPDPTSLPGDIVFELAP